ncbi:putative eka-like protein [Erysiphe necator]|uniref:Putative eka-like protein n=1 Tax=Uncinula necator TaxID=52586 RepID=A0A0B1P666_UNCNE|nr:putative eka-like protein [Erysiphe necator]
MGIARVVLNNSTQVNPTGRQSHRPANKEKSKILASQSVVLSDTRLFVRLPQDHEWRKLSPVGIRKVIVKKYKSHPPSLEKLSLYTQVSP